VQEEVVFGGLVRAGFQVVLAEIVLFAGHLHVAGVLARPSEQFFAALEYGLLVIGVAYSVLVKLVCVEHDELGAGYAVFGKDLSVPVQVDDCQPLLDKVH